ncbi:MAG TPA: hypothetical protein VFF49_06635 [Thermodesulfobacteriota bacterium]|nr:hypothetical protein [Thermodesulfobacteriota bacterium]
MEEASTLIKRAILAHETAFLEQQDYLKAQYESKKINAIQLLERRFGYKEDKEISFYKAADGIVYFVYDDETTKFLFRYSGGGEFEIRFFCPKCSKEIWQSFSSLERLGEIINNSTNPSFHECSQDRSMEKSLEEKLIDLLREFIVDTLDNT